LLSSKKDAIVKNSTKEEKAMLNANASSCKVAALEKEIQQLRIRAVRIRVCQHNLKAARISKLLDKVNDLASYKLFNTEELDDTLDILESLLLKNS
jgi:hypothetical protein